MLGGFLAQLRVLLLERRTLWMTSMLVLGALLSVAVYKQQVLRDLPVAVIDRDNSAVSRTLRRYIDASREVRVVSWAPTTVEEARAALVRGDLAGVVVIPKGAFSNVKRGRRAQILTAVDMSNIVEGKSVRRGITLAAKTVEAGVRIELMSKAGISKAEATKRALPTRSEVDAAFNPSTNFSHYLAAPLAFFLLQIYVLLLSSRALRRERTWPRRVGALAAVLGLNVLLGALIVQFLLPWVGIEAKSEPALIAAMLLLWSAASVVFATAMSALAKDPFQATQMTVLPGMLSLTLSGITWPRDQFGPVFAAISDALPFTPFAQGMQMLLYRPLPSSSLEPEFSQLGLHCLAYLLLTVTARLVKSTWHRAHARRPLEATT